MSALNVLTALVMATQERTREIGIFAAIGWSNARIMMSIVIEGILMCVSGCVLGVLLSLLAAFAFPRIPAIGNLISFKPSVALIAPVVVAAFVLCVLGALLPAWRAVRMRPARALLPLCARLRGGVARARVRLRPTGQQSAAAFMIGRDCDGEAFPVV